VTWHRDSAIPAAMALMFAIRWGWFGVRPNGEWEEIGYWRSPRFVPQRALALAEFQTSTSLSPEAVPTPCKDVLLRSRKDAHLRASALAEEGRKGGNRCEYDTKVSSYSQSPVKQIQNMKAARCH
jgi:hypothetical protein